MRRYLPPFIAALTVCLVTLADGARAQILDHRFAPGTPPITVRPSALAQVVSGLAGSPVNVQRARILWVVDSHAVVIESDSMFDRKTGVGERHGVHLRQLRIWRKVAPPYP